MASVIDRPMRHPLIGALALILLACVPVHGAYERGPVRLQFTNMGCSGEPAATQQLVHNMTLDLGLGECLNTSTPSQRASMRYTCENGEYRQSQFYTSDVCSGTGEYFSYATHLCFVGLTGKKRDVESTNPFEMVSDVESSKRLPGTFSNVILCNPGEPWTLVPNTDVDTNVHVLDTTLPVPCASPGSCAEGTAHLTMYNSTDRVDAECDQAVGSEMEMGGARVGECYLISALNIRSHCNSNSMHLDIHAHGCDAPWYQRYGTYFPYQHDQCDRVEEVGDVKFYCPSYVVQPEPSAAASLQPLRLLFVFILIAFIGAVPFV